MSVAKLSVAKMSIDRLPIAKMLVAIMLEAKMSVGCNSQTKGAYTVVLVFLVWTVQCSVTVNIY